MVGLYFDNKPTTTNMYLDYIHTYIVTRYIYNYNDSINTQHYLYFRNRSRFRSLTCFLNEPRVRDSIMHWSREFHMGTIRLEKQYLRHCNLAWGKKSFWLWPRELWPVGANETKSLKSSSTKPKILHRYKVYAFPTCRDIIYSYVQVWVYTIVGPVYNVAELTQFK